VNTDKIIVGQRIRIRAISLRDCTQNYVDWLNDNEVNQYLETRWVKQDLQSVKEFVISQMNSEYSFLFAIELNDTGRHIGNIKIGPINKRYSHADISYFIGDKSMWNTGIATEAISLVIRFGFETLQLHRIEAGAYAAAVGSWKALEHNGFMRESVFREQVISGGKYMDVYRYGLLETEYNLNNKERIK